MAKERYYVLGERASIFFDPVTKLKVLSRDKSKPDKGPNRLGERTKIALRNGHIIELDGPSTKAEAEIENEEVELSDMSKKELVQYLQDNYEVEEEDLKAFKAKNKDEMVEYLEGLVE